MSHESDAEKVKALVPQWYSTRLWAEDLLCRTLALSHPKDVLDADHRGRKRIPGTTWFYRTHGLGVDIEKGLASGGIDFDFDKPHPDAWRLHIFATKQINAGNIASEDYWELVDDEERFVRAAERVLAELPNEK